MGWLAMAELAAGFAPWTQVDFLGSWISVLGPDRHVVLTVLDVAVPEPKPAKMLIGPGMPRVATLPPKRQDLFGHGGYTWPKLLAAPTRTKSAELLLAEWGPWRVVYRVPATGTGVLHADVLCALMHQIFGASE